MDLAKLRKEDVGFALVMTNRLNKILMSQELSSVGISMGQPQILDYLSVHDGCIQNDLATHCHLKPASVTSIIANMEEQGLIKRVACVHDKRKIHVYISEEGKNKRDIIRQKRLGVASTITKGFSDEEVSVLLGYLDRIFDNLLEHINEEGEGHND